MHKIAFIGLGIMGKPMANNLRKAGHALVVYDIVAPLVDAVLRDGIQGALSSSDAAPFSYWIRTRSRARSVRPSRRDSMRSARQRAAVNPAQPPFTSEMTCAWSLARCNS